MEDVKPEEKSPLLLYMVDGENENMSKNNKRVHFDKGRLYGISSGATAVFTEFPNYISPCWVTALLSCLIFFMMLMLMISSMGMSNISRIPRCTHSHIEENTDNKTIHLVHDLYNWNQEQLRVLEMIKNEYQGFNVHLVLLRLSDSKKEDNRLKQPTSVSLLSTITNESSEAVTQPVSTIPIVNQAVIEIKRIKRSKKMLKNLKRKKREHMEKVRPFPIGLGMKSLLDILLNSRMVPYTKIKGDNETHIIGKVLNATSQPPPTTIIESQPKTLDDVLCEFPGITVNNVTFEEAFSNTPLENNWRKLNTDLAVFAVRILELWQHGGLSFKIDDEASPQRFWDDMDNFSVAPEIMLKNLDEALMVKDPANAQLTNFILAGKRSYEALPKEIVTADDEGLHIYSKMPCHAFFGEILMNLKRASGHETPKRIIKRSLEVFCRHSSVGKNYCQNLIRRRA